MKKFILIFLLLLFSGKSFAQLDTEHWFAPMMTRIGFYPRSIPQHALYISTNEVVPFKVTIFNNNIALGDVMVSKGNPQRFTILRKYIITEDEKDLFKRSRLGIYTKGDKPYYANLRFSITGELGFISSKGQAGLGKTFYAAAAPIANSEKEYNFMTGILATEDNTQINVSDYDSILVFAKPQASTINFKLNKGESYIIEGSGFEPDNYDGFIGAKIVSNHPISVTNGNYAGNFPIGGTDILMDQSVPIERLGNEFALVKGNGTIGTKMESALVIATQNNTEIYVNSGTSPIVTLDEGEYYIIPDIYYQAQGGNVYNMYIKSTQVIYLYQLYAGSGVGNEKDTGDLTYIPPLNCFLPKTVGEIGNINENNGVGETGYFIRKKRTKLNIITQTGAIVDVNGVPPLASEGPYSLAGNPNWVTYSIENVTGNITVNSTKAVMAGIIGGDSVSGFGGFFAGVSSIPVVSIKGGSCIPGIILETNSDLDSYQWKINGVDIPGANSYLYTPAQPGNYTVVVTRGSCTLTTAPIKVLNCVKETVFDTAICQILNITPQFSVSTQTVDPASVVVTQIPQRGTYSVDQTTGIITYNPYPRVYGIDTFTYKFCGTDFFEDCEEVTVHVDVRKLEVQDDTIFTCSANGMGIFNLTLADINETLPVTKKYYRTFLAAQNEDPSEEILNFTGYSSAEGSVFVVAKTSDGCSEIAEISLKFLQGINTALYNSQNCDDDFDGIIKIKLSDITKALLPSSSGLSVRYYATRNLAQSGLSGNLPNDYSYTTATTVFIRVDAPNCTPIILPIPLQIGSSFPLIKSHVTVSNCSYDIDNNSTIDLSQYTPQFTVETGAIVKYYPSLQNAKSETNEISNPVLINSADVYYLRFSKNKFCPVIGVLTLNLPKASQTLKDKAICTQSTTVLDAGIGFQDYLWSTGESTSSIEVGVGEYFVDLTSTNGCIYRQKVKVTLAELTSVTAVNITGDTVEIFAEGGRKPYQYSIDGINYQASNIFSNVPKGPHTAYVRSSDNCGIAQKDFMILAFNNVFTPNDDGVNDVFDFSILQNKKEVSVEIYNRSGSLVFKNSSGIYLWSGKENGRKLPSETYWYVIRWIEPDSDTVTVYNGWVLLKNR